MAETLRYGNELLNGFPDKLVDRIDATGDCWEWTGAKTKAGYGTIHLGEFTVTTAHRAVWESLVGPIPADMVLHHNCINISCVNPDHLAIVTQKENVRLSHRVHRRMCRKGHRMVGDNLWINSEGTRVCRTCRDVRQKAHYYASTASKGVV